MEEPEYVQTPEFRWSSATAKIVGSWAPKEGKLLDDKGFFARSSLGTSGVSGSCWELFHAS